MKFLFLILILITNVEAATEQEFSRFFHKAIKVLVPTIKQVSHKKYISACDPTAKVTDENGDVITARCGFARVGCSLVNCNSYEVDYAWYSNKKYAPAVYDANGVEITPAEVVPEYYETIMMFSKPSKAVIMTEVDSILAAKQAKLDWRNRVLFIQDARVLLKRCGNNEVNAQSVLNEIHKRKNAADMVLLGCIESEKVILDAEKTASNAMAVKIQTGKAVRNACQAALDLIAGYNVANNLTQLQLDTMQATFDQAEKALRSSRPMKAKTLIEAIAPDEVAITTAMKLEVLAILDSILAQTP